MHDVITVGVPLLAIIAGILFNRQDATALRLEFHTLRSEFHSLRSEMNTRFDSIQRDMREFYAEQARHDVRLHQLEQPQKR